MYDGHTCGGLKHGLRITGSKLPLMGQFRLCSECSRSRVPGFASELFLNCFLRTVRSVAAVLACSSTPALNFDLPRSPPLLGMLNAQCAAQRLQSYCLCKLRKHAVALDRFYVVPLLLLLQKPPPDPLEGVPEQPEVVDDHGFKREHDHDFERNWHVVALQRDETEDIAEERLRIREEVSVRAFRIDCGPLQSHQCCMWYSAYGQARRFFWSGDTFFLITESAVGSQNMCNSSASSV